MVTKDSKELSKGNLLTKTEIEGIQTCPKCGNTRILIDRENDEIVCMSCEFIVHQKGVNGKTERKNVDGTQGLKSARCSTSLTYTIHDKGASTVIDWHDRDICGKNGAVGQKVQVYRLRGWQRRVRISDSTEQNLAFALSEIIKIANQLNLPKNIVEIALVIYRKAVKEHVINGHSIQSGAAAALYLSCRQCGFSRILDEIAQTVTVDKREIWRCYRCLIKEHGFSVSPPRSTLN
jgi:transcription initiation factor TFIIB